MEDRKSTRRVPLGILVGLSGLVLATGSATAWWVWQAAPTQQSAVPTNPSAQTLHSPAVQPSAPTAGTSQSSASTVTIERTVEIYWLKDANRHMTLAPARVKLKVVDQPDAVLQATLTQLLAGSNQPNLISTIPKATKLRSLQVASDGIHIDLSSDFKAGGGSASMTGRVAQITYTVTSIDPKAKVWISVEGKPLGVLGGEGLELSQPITRSQFEQDFTL
ncbi:MAG: GerMN domain-containing protein [Scytolyngbya sp. HA4215-MV1]|nr:GerMN domain-containing protein [Scytolyngbya sp. HA4215-MV1]